MKTGFLTLITLLTFGITMTLAQGDCPAFIATAFETTRTVCEGIEADMLCIGSPPVKGSAVLGAAEVLFTKSGDVASLPTLKKMSSHVTGSSYGVMRIRAQAFLPESWETIEIDVLAFGEVSLETRGEDGGAVKTIDVRVITGSGANLRSQPVADAPVVGQWVTGQQGKATGRLADGSWLRIQTLNGETGWLIAQSIRPLGDVNSLAEISPDAPPIAKLIKPMQSIVITTKPEDAACADAPASGVIIQSPDDVGIIELNINDTLVSLNGTLHIQSKPDDQFALNLIEGEATFEINGVAIEVEAGKGLVLPSAEDAPTEAQPYDYSSLYMLPVELLPREILVAAPIENFIIPAVKGVDPIANLTPNDICTIAAVSDINLRAGPGTGYRLRTGGMTSGDSAHPDGRATGTDGRVWWRLTHNVWVSSDIVQMRGACFALPAYEPSPP